MINQTTDRIIYVQGGDGLSAIVVVNDNGEIDRYAVYTDHLGSILTLTTESEPIVYASQSFDPWGRHRDPETWSSDFTPEDQPKWLYRGFTGHEHIPMVQLIHMNGRLYDPIVAQMLGPDLYVTDGTSTTAFNRYAYVHNNPLKYTDPSGDHPALVVVAFAVTSAWVSGSIVNQNPLWWQWEWNSTTVNAVVAGAVIGATLGYGGYIIGAKAAAAKVVGAQAVKLSAVNKAFLTGCFSGSLNAINQHDGEFGMGTLAYFAAGFAGGFLAGSGLGLGELSGQGFITAMKLGAAGTINATMGFAMGKDTPYEIQQHFVGGALSAYAATAIAAKAMGAAKASYGSKFSKFANPFAKYGLQGSAADFAYTDEYYYRARNAAQHAGIFAFAGIAGIAQDVANIQIFKGDSFGWRTANSFIQKGLVTTAGLYGVAWVIGKPGSAGYHGLYPYMGSKATSSGFKALFYSLKLY